MRDLSYKVIEIKGCSAFYEAPFKPEKLHVDRYADKCLNCTKETCKRGECEMTGGKK